jgi:methyltransferase
VAESLSKVFENCPWPEGYDLKVGTSERGSTIDEPSFALPEFRHAIIVFGGRAGLEESSATDSELQVLWRSEHTVML